MSGYLFGSSAHSHDANLVPLYSVGSQLCTAYQELLTNLSSPSFSSVICMKIPPLRATALYGPFFLQISWTARLCVLLSSIPLGCSMFKDSVFLG